MTIDFGTDHSNGTIQITNNQLLFIYSLELNQFHEGKLFRCEKYNRIRFVIGPSLYGQKIRLMTNYTDNYAHFDRNKFTEINIEDSNLQLCSSGSFQFVYTKFDQADKILGSFYIVVLPEIIINDPISKEPLKLSVNALQCQTVLSKLMGSIDTWKDKLQVSINTSYNMIHWTPIQELGGSNSAYSLANQHRLNQKFCTEQMKSKNKEDQFKDVATIIDWLREQGVISIIDIVLNHTANESEWLKEHPESAYNCQNSPWLRPAFLLDRLLWNFTIDVERNRWIERGIGIEINDPQQLEIIRDIIHKEYLPLINLEEFYICNITNLVEQFEKIISQYSNNLTKFSDENFEPIVLIQDPEYQRLNCTVDLENAFKFILNKIPFNSGEDWIRLALSHFKNELARLNNHKRQEIKIHIDSAIDNVLKGAAYQRFDPNGPKVKTISKNSPLATEYFTDDSNFIEDFYQKESTLYDEKLSCFYMAHNGWVMGDNPLRNFAEQDSLVYLRRELICWGDSVKLRYGNDPKDSPYLWSFMEHYVTQMAFIFQGLRMDNCHSTPIHVAQYMIDAARRVNPNLYLIAELFTSSEQLDNIFVNKLGISSLIREAMSAETPFELGRQVYRFGGEPVGSFIPDNLKLNDQENLYSRPLVPSTAHAIFFDQTHDNESAIIRRTAYDPLASSALVSMTYAATGSNRGYDELVEHHIHVVNEHRQYRSWNMSENDRKNVNLSTGIISGKRILNQLHYLLNAQGYSQAFVDQRDRDTIVVTRFNPTNHKSIVLAARTAFFQLHQNYAHHLEPLKIEGKFEKILFEMKIDGRPDDNFERDSMFINGYSNLRSIINLTVKSNDSDMVNINKTDDHLNVIQFKNFAPSSVIAFSFDLLDHQNEALRNIQEQIKQFDSVQSEISIIINKLNLIDLNYVLFRCNQEEIDASGGHGAYTLSNGQFVYCGLAGVMFHLAKIRSHNDLGHPLCSNLRDGNWLPDYIVDRLNRYDSTADLANWLHKIFSSLAQLPRYLIPRYFDSILSPLYILLLDRVWILHSEFIRSSDEFIRRLALGGVALIGSHSPSPLPQLHSASIPENFLKLSYKQMPTLSAGLPHFSSNYMRNWGRDTFISLKGLTLLTGRFDLAKVIIIGYGGCLRHGLIPNLLDGGNNSRYNCRDAVWWWLQSIKEYIQNVPNGQSILNENVRRIFPKDDSPSMINETVIEPLYKTMQEALEKHFNGIDFIERNAGTQIDAHMTMQGFNINVGVDRKTGFVYGGNQWNCGTWMDKMGSSSKANNRGRPATPRDGSAVEIVALSHSVLSFLAELYKKNIYPYDGVGKKSVNEYWTFEFWSEKIKENFEKCFHIGHDQTDQFINRRNIYKDTFQASIAWMDFQLRPNFLIAMSISPEMFDSDHAIEALNIVSQVLVGPLGIKTLDPSDWTYRGDYDNSNDSTDASVANGFNYHNGPEWLWLMGYYLMARLKFNKCQRDEIILTEQIVAKHYEHLTNSEWFGLPELTNSNGSYCAHSCHIQSWSHATLLEALHLMMKMKTTT